MRKALKGTARRLGLCLTVATVAVFGLAAPALAAVTGSTNHTVSFTRDGDPNQDYQYRCKAYPTPTGGTPTVSSKLDVTTYGDTRYGAIVSVGRDPTVPDTLA